MTDRALREEIRRLRIELGILNDRVAAAAGLNPRDLDILDVIDRDGPCTPSWLAERTGQRKATLTSVLARLARDGWIQRRPDPMDGRSVTLASTERFDELRALYRPADEAAAVLTCELDGAELELVTQVLERITERLREELSAPLSRARR